VIGIVRRPADDLTILVALARVGAADRGRITTAIGLAAPVLVVGQRAANLGLARMGGDPFGPVHGGGADSGGRLAGVDADLGLRAHSRRLGGQFDPAAAAAVRELGDIESAVF